MATSELLKNVYSWPVFSRKQTVFRRYASKPAVLLTIGEIKYKDTVSRTRPELVIRRHIRWQICDAALGANNTKIFRKVPCQSTYTPGLTFLALKLTGAQNVLRTVFT
ncbi:unnamed protein product [Ixodes pacificus]